MEQNIEDLLSATQEEVQNGVKDSCGVIYSKDGRKLLKAYDIDAERYLIKAGAEIICSDALSMLDVKLIGIPNSVKYIGESAFFNILDLQKLIIPDSVVCIGRNAFESCQGLEKVIISDSLTTIETELFMDCASLQDVYIPDSVTSIGAAAFYDCYALKRIRIPASVQTIRYNAFGKCPSLQEITIPKGSKERFQQMLHQSLWDKLVEKQAQESEF